VRSTHKPKEGRKPIQMNQDQQLMNTGDAQKQVKHRFSPLESETQSQKKKGPKGFQVFAQEK